MTTARRGTAEACAIISTLSIVTAAAVGGLTSDAAPRAGEHKRSGCVDTPLN
jgi:hypothetical protein